MLIQIIYSINLETKRVQEVVKKLSWYKEKGYKITLPKNLKEDAINYEDIYNSVWQEYSDSLYKKVSSKILLEWVEKNIEIQLQNELPKFKLSLPEKVIVQLTRYWTQWSYNPPNNIILHIEQKRPLISVILHEILHLIIHSYIKDHNVSHWHKEAIVDFLFEKILPDISFRQSIKKDYTDDINTVFMGNENLNFSEIINNTSVFQRGRKVERLL